MSYKKARTELDKIKLMTYIQYIQQCWKGTKQNHNKKLMCVNYATLGSLLASYGLCSTVQFPSRIQNNSHSAIDNIFINTFKFSNFSLYPIINGLSDHDAQSIIMRKILEQNCNTCFYFN